jgi:hypothetical protein
VAPPVKTCVYLLDARPSTTDAERKSANESQGLDALLTPI